jgi:hypothetical protein
MTWRPIQTHALADDDMGDHARRSVIRKSYLYLVLFISVIGGMVAAGTMVYDLVNAALGGGAHNFWVSVLNELTALIVFIVVLVYHLLALRADGAARADVLAEKQAKFSVLVFDHDGKFGNAVKATFAKRAQGIPVTVMDIHAAIPVELKADAVILPGSLAVNTTETVEAWLRSQTEPDLPQRVLERRTAASEGLAFFPTATRPGPPMIGPTNRLMEEA